MTNYFNRHFPNYPDDTDYTTNTPSYYDDLARKQKLIQLLAEKIWEYENTLNESLEEIEKRLTDYILENDLLMNERLENWDQRIDEMPEEMRSLFVTWLNDGTLEQIINHDVLGNKADKEYVDNELNKKADLNFVEDEFTKIVYYSTPEMFEGVNDSQRIQKALNSSSMEVICKGDYSITETITIPANKKLDLTNALLVINKDVDGIVLSAKSTLQGGLIEIGKDIKNTYSKRAVVIGHSTHSKLYNTEISNYGAYSGTGIGFDVNGTGKRIAYANLDNFYVLGFNIGVDVTVPNIPPHVKDDSRNIDNWITTSKIKGFIADSNQGLRIVDESGKGQAIQGMDIVLRGQTGKKNNNFNETIYARCVQSTFNVILDDAGFDPKYVDHFIVFDKDSRVNTYLGPNEKVVDNGIDNIIINSHGHFRPDYFTKTEQNDAYGLGVINNLLFHAHERFTVNHHVDNGTMVDANECFKYGKRGNSVFYRTSNTSEGSVRYVIDFGKNTTVRRFAVSLNAFGYGSYVKLRAYNNTDSKWYETEKMIAKDFHMVDLVSDYDITVGNILKLEVILYIDGEHSQDNIKINGIYAYGGGPNNDVGGLLSKSGGSMYGDVTFSKGTGPILTTLDGTKKYRLGVNNAGELSVSLLP